MYEENSLARSDLDPLEKVQYESIFIKPYSFNSCGKLSFQNLALTLSYLLSLLIKAKLHYANAKKKDCLSVIEIHNTTQYKTSLKKLSAFNVPNELGQ